jgi:hypothetical protein
MNKYNKTNKKYKKTNKKYKKTKKVKTKKLILGMKKCEEFCRNDYMPNQHKVIRKVLNQKTITKEHYKIRDDSLHLLCKAYYCDPKCNSFWQDDKQGRIDFEKRLTNGFLDTYSKKEVEMFQKKGAMSACYGPDTSRVNYDVFHK